MHQTPELDPGLVEEVEKFVKTHRALLKDDPNLLFGQDYQRLRVLGESGFIFSPIE